MLISHKKEEIFVSSVKKKLSLTCVLSKEVSSVIRVRYLKKLFNERLAKTRRGIHLNGHFWHLYQTIVLSLFFFSNF